MWLLNFEEQEVNYLCAEQEGSTASIFSIELRALFRITINSRVTIIQKKLSILISSQQNNCLVSMVSALGELIQLLVERDREELLILNNITSTTSHSNFTAIVNEASYHRAPSPMPLLAEKVVINNKHIKQLSP